jgi:hypothetical protein
MNEYLLSEQLRQSSAIGREKYWSVLLRVIPEPKDHHGVAYFKRTSSGDCCGG